jgi:HPt (histidine-containing phosphotransfer) domain-containing protein
MIDWDRVAELREEIGVEDFGEVVELFLDEVEAVLRRLRDDPRPAGFEEDFHFLKGSALNLGFAGFGALCYAAEKASAAGAAATVDVAGALECYDASKKAFFARAAEFGLAA